ncbi:uncharacterized protein SRS1_11287 [Sporisorium reilianum f. sp. reilianum]|uniref:DUF4211 domain-containing protein n=1 Tax=Sporisorium reilianum f. sp. reilianum TaxID=72559 RepID=A0A2N8UNV7_9BASI|nr:uncharacterized protein SRS1_11287 [Sporisorium reilianum f. sp. reilianum]
MPPKKKQKVSKPPSSAASASPSKPAASSSSRSTRSRTRSASIASTAPLPKKSSKKTKSTKAVKAEPKDDALANDDEERLSPVWDGEQQPLVECWVEIPLMPRPSSTEDGLGFIRPRDKAAMKEKGKHKEHADSLVWHVDQQPADADPFYFAEQDLRQDAEGEHLVAVRPRAGKSGKRKEKERSVGPQQQKRRKSREGSRGSTAQPAEASSSSKKINNNSSSSSNDNDNDKSTAPSIVRTASLLEAQPPTNLPPRNEDGLQDMFLGTSDAAPAQQLEQEDDDGPLFFEDAIEEVDQLRDEAPVQSQPSQRPRIKTSPTYGDRIAQGSSSHRSRSSTPRPAKPASSSRNDTATSSKEPSRKDKDSKKEKGKEKEIEREKTHSKSNKRARSVGSDNDSEPKSNRKSDDVKNLRSELNEDAFARSTGPRHKEEYRNKLAAFAQARKKARQERGQSISSGSDNEAASTHRKRLGDGRRATTVSSDSDSSDSGSDDSDSSSSSSSSSSSGDSKDFIVADDQVEYDDGFQPDEDEVASSPAKSKSSQSQHTSKSDRRGFERDSDGRIRLVPVSAHAAAAGTSASSILAAHGLGGAGARKGLDELCLDWIEWAAARVLVTWSSLSLADRERLERNRAALKSRMRSIEESVGTVSMRRQFKWYLTQYPKIDVEALFSDEVDQYGTLAKNGCGICHRKSQRAQFKVTFSGMRYNQETLAPLKKRGDASDSDEESDSESSESSDDDDSASDRSSDNETWRDEGEDARDRPTFTFFAGNHCAQRAAVLHKLHHWEWTTMQTLARHESIRYVRRLLWRKHRMGRGHDGRMGAGAWEVWLAVTEMISPTGRCTWKGRAGEKERGKKGSELERLRRRLKSLSEQAIEVNRAR